MRVALIAVVAASCAFGQSFEVASVKPNRSGDGRISLNRPDAMRLTAENTPLRFLITFAWDIRDTQLTGGPSWMQTERWDVVAKLENPAPKTPEGAEAVRAALRALLEERFHLKIHKESKEMAVSVLTVAKGGPKLKESAPDAKAQMRGGNGSLDGTKVTMLMFSRSLSSYLGRTVTDGTGLKGEYDINIQFAPEQNGVMAKLAGAEHPETESDKPALSDALQDQMGLKLETRKEPVDLIVVDSAEKPVEN